MTGEVVAEYVGTADDTRPAPQASTTTTDVAVRITPKSQQSSDVQRQYRRRTTIGIVTGILVGTLLLGPIGGVAGGFIGGHIAKKKNEREMQNRSHEDLTPFIPPAIATEQTAKADVRAFDVVIN